MQEVKDLRSRCPDSMLKDIKEAHPECLWFEKSLVGEGVDAKVYQVCCNSDCKFVVKQILLDDANKLRQKVTHEVAMQQRFASLGLAPNVEDAWICDHEGLIIMKRLDMSLIEYFKYLVGRKSMEVIEEKLALAEKSLNEMFAVAHANGLVHGDPHLNNVMVNIDDDGHIKEIQFIDFLRSREVSPDQANQEMEEGPKEVGLSFKKLRKDVQRMADMLRVGTMTIHTPSVLPASLNFGSPLGSGGAVQQRRVRWEDDEESGGFGGGRLSFDDDDEESSGGFGGGKLSFDDDEE